MPVLFRLRQILTLAAAVTSVAALLYSLKAAYQPGSSDTSASDACPQVPALAPENPLDTELDKLYATPSFRLDAYTALSGAIQVPTESYDDMRPVGQDPRWIVFAELHRFLETRFPLVYSSLRVTKVNTYGIVFHWQGSDDALLPVLMTAHQDVVPVEPLTVEQWKYPPYSGHYDGTWIWGRGSCDDKSDLVAMFLVVDTLLQHGKYTPRRTFVLAFGFDEEASGREGAGHIAAYLEATYGKDGFALLLDEGGGYGTSFGGDLLVALPEVSEKGYLDVGIDVSTPGGHPGVPPPNTSIGLLAALLTALAAHPPPPHLARTGTVFAHTQCAAAYADSITFPPALRALARAARTNDAALARLTAGLLRHDPRVYGALLGTTQAADLVRGGGTAGALPERAHAVVNHRIAEHSSVRALQAHVAEVVTPVAAVHNLTLDAFGARVDAGGLAAAAGHVALRDAFDSALEPSPVSPTALDIGTPYTVLSGTIKATLESAAATHDAPGVVVVPALALGNTDTLSYWNLTRHIFRYSHARPEDTYNGIHTVNEARLAEAFIEQIRFLTKFVLNCDESVI